MSVGITLGSSAQGFTVASVHAGSSAESSCQVRVGDFVIAIDGIGLEGQTLDKAASYLYGQPDTPCSLKLIKPDGTVHIVVLRRMWSQPVSGIGGYPSPMPTPSSPFKNRPHTAALGSSPGSYSPAVLQDTPATKILGPAGPPPVESAVVGLLLSRESHCCVVAGMLPFGSARWCGKIEKGDQLTHIDGEPVSHLNPEQVVRLLDDPSPKKSTVELSVRRERPDRSVTALSIDLPRATSSTHSHPATITAAASPRASGAFSKRDSVKSMGVIPESEVHGCLQKIAVMLRNGDTEVPYDVEMGTNTPEGALLRQIMEAVAALRVERASVVHSLQEAQTRLDKKKEQIVVLSEQLQHVKNLHNQDTRGQDHELQALLQEKEEMFFASRAAIEREVEEGRARERDMKEQLQVALREIERLQKTWGKPEDPSHVRQELIKEREAELLREAQVQEERHAMELIAKDEEVKRVLAGADQEIHKYAEMIEEKNKVTQSVMKAKNQEIERLKRVLNDSREESERLETENKKLSREAQKLADENKHLEKTIAEMQKMEREHEKEQPMLAKLLSAKDDVAPRGPPMAVADLSFSQPSVGISDGSSASMNPPQPPLPPPPKVSKQQLDPLTPTIKKADSSTTVQPPLPPPATKPETKAPPLPPPEKKSTVDNSVDQDGFIGGEAVWNALLSESNPVPNRQDAFEFRGKVYHQPVYNKATGVCVIQCIDDGQILYRGWGVNAAKKAAEMQAKAGQHTATTPQQPSAAP